MTIETQKKQNYILLFAGTFASTFFLAFGLIALSLTFFPALAKTLDFSQEEYRPQLPISEERDEEIFDITKNPGKQFFPALTSVDHVEPGNWIRIPSIDVNVPLALSPSIKDADIIETLIKGAALYPNGIQPGRLGNTFIAAHSSGEPWKGTYRFAFTKLNEVQPGNVIHLDYNGTRYTYTVTGSEIVKPDPNYRVISDRPVPTVTLMACWPIWTTNQRMLVKGDLTNITKLTPTPS